MADNKGGFMSLNEFVLALVSIVIGLGMTDLLTSFHRLLRAGAAVKWDWLTLFYAALMLYTQIAFWWWQFGYPNTSSLTIAEFLLNFVFLAISFLMVASALPDEIPVDGIDLREFYVVSLRHRWSLVTVSLLLNVAVNLWSDITAGRADWIMGLFPAVGAVFAASAIKIRATWFQALTIVWIFGVTLHSTLFRAIGP